MQRCIIPTKEIYDVIIATSNTLWEISYQKPPHLLFLHRLSDTNYQLTTFSSTSTITVIFFTIALCVYVIVLLSFLYM